MYALLFNIKILASETTYGKPTLTLFFLLFYSLWLFAVMVTTDLGVYKKYVCVYHNTWHGSV